MKKLFWVAVGVGITVFVITRGKDLMHKLTPAGVAEQVTEQGKNVVSRIQGFAHDFAEAMDEREAELRAELNMAPKH